MGRKFVLPPSIFFESAFLGKLNIFQTNLWFLKKLSDVENTKILPIFATSLELVRWFIWYANAPIFCLSVSSIPHIAARYWIFLATITGILPGGISSVRNFSPVEFFTGGTLPVGLLYTVIHIINVYKFSLYP